MKKVCGYVCRNDNPAYADQLFDSFNVFIEEGDIIQYRKTQNENEAAKLYGITTIPSNVLIDPNGKVIGKDLKGKELRDKLAEILGSL